jgi:hypothetical protein
MSYGIIHFVRSIGKVRYIRCHVCAVLFPDRRAAMDQTGGSADVTRPARCTVTAVVTHRQLSHKPTATDPHHSYAINRMCT